MILAILIAVYFGGLISTLAFVLRRDMRNLTKES
jgi:hypothetical protein